MPKTTNLSIILPAFIQAETFEHTTNLASQNFLGKSRYDVLKPLRQWLDELEIQNRELAHFIAKLIPAQCPFERDIVLFGRTIAHIPPMCKLNPLYDQFVGLRFRALCYLVDQCGEDIQSYC
ncbi:Mo-dependent nitrogenase C-terminal domain-containing protein [Nostoc sp. FACHB-87]|uniref:Mo-dependent nitrogenase C-terminal domain-containing protein n=1 Tax=Nostocales TaxID=1161 RepID=UPI00168368C6|nr:MULTISPECIES: Mo-dependent nitrogenase C-terminal domain-containing protein [Nostocales]MBD2301081.1 Mo-dependent nitrogenase C-terminal domain-containing protein [Nostoc sp. FACHB-190]MBD2457035.1 Mo-dependent nitrogenase C-terminal domain-containing protein [Nostoc sp. FACHB-87]MBD2477053.1 Mo-dependent nitrogenase C-terminal domain-containing protein [Anabaena sp. FACHB-83]MBD2491210.1 Mo-dependent nitrogenase C-terminal domain-containing protein [Aulosira sp. FACHB-615]